MTRTMVFITTETPTCLYRLFRAASLIFITSTISSKHNHGHWGNPRRWRIDALSSSWSSSQISHEHRHGTDVHDFRGVLNRNHWANQRLGRGTNKRAPRHFSDGAGDSAQLGGHGHGVCFPLTFGDRSVKRADRYAGQINKMLMTAACWKGSFRSKTLVIVIRGQLTTQNNECIYYFA